MDLEIESKGRGREGPKVTSRDMQILRNPGEERCRKEPGIVGAMQIKVRPRSPPSKAVNHVTLFFPPSSAQALLPVSGWGKWGWGGVLSTKAAALD